MGFKVRRVSIIVISLNGPIRIQSARFKHRGSVVIFDDHMEPGSARGVCGREFMTAQVLHKRFGLETEGAYADAANTDPGRLGLQKGNRYLRRSSPPLRQYRNITILEIN